jgi:hypothetical protein
MTQWANDTLARWRATYRPSRHRALTQSRNHATTQPRNHAITQPRNHSKLLAKYNHIRLVVALALQCVPLLAFYIYAMHDKDLVVSK